LSSFCAEICLLTSSNFTVGTLALEASTMSGFWIIFLSKVRTGEALALVDNSDSWLKFLLLPNANLILSASVSDLSLTKSAMPSLASTLVMFLGTLKRFGNVLNSILPLSDCTLDGLLNTVVTFTGDGSDVVDTCTVETCVCGLWVTRRDLKRLTFSEIDSLGKTLTLRSDLLL